MSRIFQIGPVVIGNWSAIDLTQEYQAIGGESIPRAMSGKGLKQMSSWNKLRVVTAGAGWAPPSIAALDFSARHVLRCVKPMPVLCVGLSALLPASRRRDAGAEPYALATLPQGAPVRCAVTLVGDVATAQTVPGAVAYEIFYYPEIVVWAQRPNTTLVRNDGTYRWQIVCEEE